MGRFTALSHDEVAALAREFALGTLFGFRVIAAGTVNSNFQIDTESGRFFLRINEGKAEREVAYEVEVLAHLVRGGVPTPLPLPAKDGRRFADFHGQLVSVFPWQDGRHVDSDTISEEDCASIGRELARLHRAGQGMPGRHEGRYTFDAIALAYEKFANSRDPSLARALAILEEEIGWLDEHRDARASLPRGLIHADLFPDNVLMGANGVAALLDFEQACVGAYCYDLAVAINAWCFSEALVQRRVVALLAGYQEVRGLESEEIAGLWVELRGAALRFTVTRIRDVYLPAGGTPVGGKDFRRFLMRLESWQGLDGEGVADLAKEAGRL